MKEAKNWAAINSAPGHFACKRCGALVPDGKDGCHDCGHCPRCWKYRKKARETAKKRAKKVRSDCSRCNGEGEIRGTTNTVKCKSCGGNGFTMVTLNSTYHLPDDYECA